GRLRKRGPAPRGGWPGPGRGAALESLQPDGAVDPRGRAGELAEGGPRVRLRADHRRVLFALRLERPRAARERGSVCRGRGSRSGGDSGWPDEELALPRLATFVD